MKQLFVVGATDGIGLALCNNYLAAGWRVALVGKDPVKTERVGTELRKKLGLHRDNTAGDLLAPDYSSLPSDTSPLAPRRGSIPTPFGGRTSIPKASAVVYAKRTHHG